MDTTRTPEATNESKPTDGYRQPIARSGEQQFACIKQQTNTAEREIRESLQRLESSLKEQGMRIASTRIDDYQAHTLTQREADQLFSAEIAVEPRR